MEYDYKSLIDAYINAMKYERPGGRFIEHDNGLLAALKKLFDISFDDGELIPYAGFHQRNLATKEEVKKFFIDGKVMTDLPQPFPPVLLEYKWEALDLFNSAVRIYLHAEKAEKIGAGQMEGSLGWWLLAVGYGKPINDLQDQVKVECFAYLEKLLKLIYGDKTERVFTSADLMAIGFNDSNPPAPLDYFW